MYMYISGGVGFRVSHRFQGGWQIIFTADGVDVAPGGVGGARMVVKALSDIVGFYSVRFEREMFDF